MRRTFAKPTDCITKCPFINRLWFYLEHFATSCPGPTSKKLNLTGEVGEVICESGQTADDCKTSLLSGWKEIERILV
jgi:hypothetical protein